MTNTRGELFKMATLVLLSVACAEKPGDSPKATIVGYLDALFRGSPEAAYDLLSNSDRATRSLGDFKESARVPTGSLADHIKQKTSYKITDVRETGDSASVQVEITAPDVKALLGDLLASAMASAFNANTKDGKAEMEAKITEKISKGELPLKTENKPFQLRREAGSWRVFMDYATEAKVTTAMEEAASLRKAKKLGAALAKIDEVLELRGELVEAKTQRAEVAGELKAFEVKKAYIDKVKLYDLTAKYYTTYLDERLPGVEFKLRNTGERTLQRVQVTVYFKDKGGNMIHEEEYTPVLVSEYSFGGDNKPLKPNYVWQMERGKFYKASSVPSEWSPGAASAAVTDIEFAPE